MGFIKEKLGSLKPKKSLGKIKDTAEEKLEKAKDLVEEKIDQIRSKGDAEKTEDTTAEEEKTE